MSDKPVQMTIQGTYRGYSVSVSLECSLDSLDKAIDRLAARGVEPLRQPANAGSQGSQGSKSDHSGLAAFEGVFVRSMRPDSEKGPALRVSLRGANEDTRTFDIWDATQSEQLLTVARANVSRLRVRYVTKANGKYTNHAIKHWQLVA
jgi:hypothetical protein